MLYDIRERARERECSMYMYFIHTKIFDTSIFLLQTKQTRLLD